MLECSAKSQVFRRFPSVSLSLPVRRVCVCPCFCLLLILVHLWKQIFVALQNFIFHIFHVFPSCSSVAFSRRELPSLSVSAYVTLDFNYYLRTWVSDCVLELYIFVFILVSFLLSLVASDFYGHLRTCTGSRINF